MVYARVFKHYYASLCAQTKCPFFSFYKAYYKSIPELAPGYCTDVICSVILKSAFFIIFNLPYGSHISKL